MSEQKFWQLSPQERRGKLKLNRADRTFWAAAAPLSASVLNGLSENVIGQMSLPVGVVPDIRIMNDRYTIPLATEEPSVVAAINHGFKLLDQGRAITSATTRHGLTGEIGLQNVTPEGITALKQTVHQLYAVGLAAHPTLTVHGGTIHAIMFDDTALPDVTLLVHVDPGQAMGANMLNDILEAIAAAAAECSGGTVLFAVLTNDGRDDLTTVQATLPADAVTPVVADRIAALSAWAQRDTRRAATHNKGIMNGVAALTLATGNDTRAVNASAHAYAALDGHYRGLSQWHVQADGRLRGRITLPLPLGTVGGATKVLPSAQHALALLGQPSVARLQIVAAAVGLAANLAALNALVTDGIQHGHMRLQYHSLAVRVGARPEEIVPLAQQLAAQAHPSEAAAAQLLAEMRKELQR
ncbi:hydroxymethylglutaryl-CoA reductase [Schleiferilactobacillus shenzhenensis]|uniref:Hydroxymethylglutaryl-CoA reductase n=1 Tax=Schleiferilactobacillus shenzhenensis LY-73 TaxID=1231336 RepID=U4TXN6_9LACO|nr:hydroxymethylglutaryl-CoA reductase [Schleiferilactobacillus shenzhenensis]ERL66112.1 hydroxymethylglutaryl-CoA reductase [Schleiferilactobacillus shenzhenensis LY-73]